MNFTGSSIVMVHNNLHSNNYYWQNKISSLITCLPNDRGEILPGDQYFYRYNFDKFTDPSHSNKITKGTPFIQTSREYNRNMRVVRCLAEESTLDVTGVLGHTNGKNKLRLSASMKD